MIDFPEGFLWGAASAPHQIEGNNLNSDWWAREQRSPGMERSGDALDSYHRYAEDMQLLADAGLTSYRFGIEWARVEPSPGHFSRAELAHYRRMIDKALELGLTPVITLHHFSSPLWFEEEGGWMGERFLERFSSYVTAVAEILDGVEWVCTLNEPNMLAFMVRMLKDHLARQKDDWTSPTVEDPRREGLPDPDPEATRNLIAAHHAARDILHARTSAKVGWTVANEALVAVPGSEQVWQRIVDARENPFLVGARGDDFIGVQAYTSQDVGPDGIVPHPVAPDNTLVGTSYRPDALGIAVRHAWGVTQGVPVLVTENGIATAEDEQRIRYTGEALRSMNDAMADGVDVVGYLHWSALDNFEWGHWAPTFGLISVDRDTFVRTAKPSLAWLGQVAVRNGRGLVEGASS